MPLSIRLDEPLQIFNHCSVHGAGGVGLAHSAEDVSHHAFCLEGNAPVLEPLHHVGQQAGLHETEEVVQGAQPGLASVRRQHARPFGTFVRIPHGVRVHALPAEESRRHTVPVGELADPARLQVHRQTTDGELRVIAAQVLPQLDGVGELLHENLPGLLVQQVQQCRLVAHQRVVVVEAHHLRAVQVHVAVRVDPVLEPDDLPLRPQQAAG
mmetsp:Transcript_58776/g.162532  ORF Transcript_58776/g.162532 Transcript_58776/m.162532 type:complete len:211 (-) Transcript_58776:156-788(-)